MTGANTNRRAGIAALAGALLLSAVPALGQQTYVTRFDAYLGYAYLNSPHVSLAEHGFQFQAGVRTFRWMSLGFDYSRATGDLTLTPDLLLPSLQQQLGAQLAGLKAAGLIPAGYALVVPVGSVTDTFAAGPQFAYRGWKAITPFIRPSCGFIRETATPKPTDAISKAIVQQLASTGVKKDSVLFMGVGWGIDLNFTRHISLRIQGDLVRDHLFDDLLKDSRGTVRFSFGPAFNFGKNIVE